MLQPKMSADLCAIGLYGLAVMGQNLALNIAQNAGVRIAVCNRSPAKVDDCVARAAKEGGLPVSGFKDVAEFIANIAKPRAVIILVQAGQPVDDTIEVSSSLGCLLPCALSSLSHAPHTHTPTHALSPTSSPLPSSCPSTWRLGT
jgi:hypothetical protein